MGAISFLDILLQKGTLMLNKPRLLTPGPTPMPERVRLVMARDMIHHRKPAFKKLLAEVQIWLQELFGTSQPVLPLAASGTGAMVAAVSNLFSPGDTVLAVEGGKFGERWAGICAAQGITVVPLKVEWGKAVTVEAVQKALEEHPEIRGVLMQISETSTGAQHPVREVAAVTRSKDVLLVADGISSVSISPCPMDEWGVDALLTGSQKGLMLPPGLALVALSCRAWKKAESIPNRDFYFNLVKERNSIAKDQTAFTPAVGLLSGLHESLLMISEAGGVDTVYRKQWALTCMARTGVRALGFELYAKEHYTWGLTSLLLPAGVRSGALLGHAAERHGVIMAAGMEHMQDSVIRIGHMGWVDWADIAAGLHALASAYTALGGHIGSRDYLEQALTAYENALVEGYPA